jgi:anti-anti-sigma factor
VNIQDRFVEECVILDIKETTFEYPKTSQIKTHVEGLLNQGHHYFVLNMSNIQVLDSFGLAVIISLLKLSKSHGGNLALYGLNQQVSRLIEVTHMDRILDIWISEAQALSQIKKPVKLAR